jgi:hypothetical protein
MHTYSDSNQVAMNLLSEEQRRRVQTLMRQSGASLRDAIRAVLAADREASRIGYRVRRSPLFMPLQLLGLWR